MYKQTFYLWIVFYQTQKNFFYWSYDAKSISVRLLKTAAPYIILPLCKVINISFHTGVFPDSIKVAKVVPIFKSGSPQDINNYRPHYYLCLVKL